MAVSRETTPERQAASRIVVGIDGSARSVAALRWAARHAALTGAQVHAVTGWDVPYTIMIVPHYTEGDYAADGRRALDQTVDQVERSKPGVVVQRHLVQKRPALASMDAADGAELLVIGSHGRNELPGTHLGSVASYCVHHAPCPVVVIRGERGRDAAA